MNPEGFPLSRLQSVSFFSVKGNIMEFSILQTLCKWAIDKSRDKIINADFHDALLDFASATVKLMKFM